MRDTIKKGTEKDTVDLVSGENPHSNGLPFVIWEFSVEAVRKKIVITKILIKAVAVFNDNRNTITLIFLLIGN